MQLALNLTGQTETLAEIDAALRTRFDLPLVTGRRSPIEQLVKGLLGSRTRSEVSLAALNALKESFTTWEQVRDADPSSIYDLIQHTTFAQNKVAYLQACLRSLTIEEGLIDLSALDDMTTTGAIVWLERLPGVGRKISASTLNVSTLERRALVIDSHHLRALRRLGLISARDDFVSAYDRVMPMVPQHWTATQIDDHHRLFKRLGQTLCRHDWAHCQLCPLQHLCRRGRSRSKTSENQVVSQ